MDPPPSTLFYQIFLLFPRYFYSEHTNRLIFNILSRVTHSNLLHQQTHLQHANPFIHVIYTTFHTTCNTYMEFSLHQKPQFLPLLFSIPTKSINFSLPVAFIGSLLFFHRFSIIHNFSRNSNKKRDKEERKKKEKEKRAWFRKKQPYIPPKLPLLLL